MSLKKIPTSKRLIQFRGQAITLRGQLSILDQLHWFKK